MPDPAAPTKQQLAVLVGTLLTGLEQLRYANAVADDDPLGLNREAAE